LAQIELGSALWRNGGQSLETPGDAGQNYGDPNRALNDIDKQRTKRCDGGDENPN